MPKAAHDPTTSRRTLLAATPALLLAAGVSPAHATAHPDAELMRRCDALVALDRQNDALLDSIQSFEDELRVEARIDALAERAKALARAVQALHPTTAAGIAAKARAAAQIVSRNLDGTVISRGIADDLAWSLIERIAHAA